MSPVTLRRFQVRYSNIPGRRSRSSRSTVWYTGGYVQDEWRPRSNLTRHRRPALRRRRRSRTPAYANPNADALTFRDETGLAGAVQQRQAARRRSRCGRRASASTGTSPASSSTQVRGGTGVFTGKPAYVWISNQIGNTGVLTGFEPDQTTRRNRPVQPEPGPTSRRTSTGAPAASVELTVTDPDFKFPQMWRTNIGVDQRLPWGLIGTAEFIYNKDVNGLYYINANLPAAQSAFDGRRQPAAVDRDVVRHGDGQAAA